MQKSPFNWQDGYIQTFTGRFVRPLELTPDDIDIVDIAHSLSMKTRWAGMSREYFSVAQHCFLTSVYCIDPLWGLLHDASEAYLNDIPTGVKLQLPRFEVIEDRAHYCVSQAFDLPWPMPACVKVVDRRMLVTEQRDLMPSGDDYHYDVEPYTWTIEPWDWKKAKDAFLRRFEELN